MLSQPKEEVVYSLLMFVITRTDLIRDVCGNGFDLIHELITNTSIVSVQIVSHVTHMKNHVMLTTLDLILQSTQSSAVDVTKISIHHKLW